MGHGSTRESCCANPYQRHKSRQEKTGHYSGRNRTLSREEQEQLFQNLSKEIKWIVTIALETGMRRSEIMSLTWENIDLSKRIVRFDKTKIIEIPARLPFRKGPQCIEGSHHPTHPQDRRKDMEAGSRQCVHDLCQDCQIVRPQRYLILWSPAYDSNSARLFYGDPCACQEQHGPPNGQYGDEVLQSVRERCRKKLLKAEEPGLLQDEAYSYWVSLFTHYVT